MVFIAMVYPILVFAERIPGYSELLTERKRGEIKSSLVVVFSMFTVLICVCWGWLGERYLVIASVLAWGLGDAAAALIGKRFGKHYIEGKFVEGRKTLEGTLAMFVVSFVSVLIILLVQGSVEWYGGVVRLRADCGSNCSSMCNRRTLYEGRYGYADLPVRGGGNYDSADSFMGGVIL